MRAPVIIDSFEDHCLYTHLRHLDQAAAQDYDSFTNVCIDAKNQNNLNFFLYTEPVMVTMKSFLKGHEPEITTDVDDDYCTILGPRVQRSFLIFTFSEIRSCNK